MEQVAAKNETPSRRITERSLAIIGFLALIALGIWLAIYSTRHFPDMIGRMGTAAVSFTSLFTPAEPSLSVVPTTIISPPLQNDADVAPIPQKPAKIIVPPLPPTDATSATPLAPTPNTAETAAYPISGTSTPSKPAPNLSGLADFETKIIATGYLTSTSTSSFIATTTIPRGMRPAVTFVIKNVGTNTAQAGWRFSASIPTQNAYVFYSPAQQALNPGDSIEYTLGFDQASPGSGRSLSIVANSDHSLGESNVSNNSATATVTILSS